MKNAFELQIYTHAKNRRDSFRDRRNQKSKKERDMISVVKEARTGDFFVRPTMTNN